MKDYCITLGWVLLLCLLATAKASLQGVASKRYVHTTVDSIRLCAWFFTIATFPALVAVLMTSCHISPTTIGLGILFGLCSALFQMTYSLAMASGPVSLSVVLANFSFAVPIIITAAVPIFNETITSMKLLSMALVAVSVILCIKPQKGKPVNRRWLIAIILSFFSCAVAALLPKLHATLGFSSEGAAFVLVGYAGAAVAMWIPSLFLKHRLHKPHPTPLSAWGWIVAVGVALGAFQMVFTFASGRFAGTVLYPLYNCLNIVLITLCGRILFKEHLTRRQLIGLGIGTAAIVLHSMI